MSRYTASARLQECTVRVPLVCNHDTATTVPAHLNGAGMGLKHCDIHIAYACADCHAWLDGGYARAGVNRAVRDLYHLQAVIRTQQVMVREGTLLI